jgi:membrane-associated phospholipid phosphatase
VGALKGDIEMRRDEQIVARGSEPGMGVGSAPRAWQRIGRRADGRPPLWIELAIVAWLFWLYDVINDFAPIRQALALRDATNLLSFERSAGLNPELTINHWLAAHAALGQIAAYYYFFAHALVTFGVLAWLWWKAPALYQRLRTSLVMVNLIAFVVFWRYPLAPPRSFPGLGYIDVIANSHALVSWHSGVLVHDADQFAAMPSLHVAWAIWCAVAVWRLTSRRVLRAAAIVYPLLTAFIVIATANHYLLDVLAGAATVALAFALQHGLVRVLAALRRRRRAEPAHGEHAHGVQGAPAQP